MAYAQETCFRFVFSGAAGNDVHYDLGVEKSLHAFRKSLEDKKVIHFISIEDVVLTDRAFGALEDAVGEQKSKIKQVELRNVFTDKKISDTEANNRRRRFSQFLAALVNATDLKDFKLVGLSEFQMDSFVEFIRASRTLQRLELMNTNIKARYSEQLARALSEAAFDLKGLVYEGNEVNDAGFEEFSRAIRRMRNLETIRFSNCGLSEHAIGELAHELQTKERLKEVALNDNVSVRNGAHALVDAFSRMRNLQVVELKNCKLGSKVIDILLALRNSQNELTELHLDGNRIKFSRAKQMVKIINESFKSLEKVTLHRNRLSAEEYAELRSLLNKKNILEPNYVIKDQESEESNTSTGTEVAAIEEHNFESIEALLSDKHDIKKFKETDFNELQAYFEKNNYDPRLALKIIQILSKFLKSDEESIHFLTKYLLNAFFKNNDNYEPFAAVFLQFFGYFEADEMPVMSDENLKNLMRYIANESLIPKGVLAHIKRLHADCPKPAKNKLKEEIAKLDINFALDLCFNPANKLQLTVGNQLKALT